MGMTAQDETPPARIRFDPIAAGWMVATIDGVRLASAPVRKTEVDLAARELAHVLGEPVGVEVRNGRGHVQRVLAGPGAERLKSLPR